MFLSHINLKSRNQCIILCMRRTLLLCIAFISLIGCTKYNIDLSCKRMNFTDISDELTTAYGCMAPEYFLIQCDVKTTQKINNERFCKTHDDKSVRIRLIETE